MNDTQRLTLSSETRCLSYLCLSVCHISTNKLHCRYERSKMINLSCLIQVSVTWYRCAFFVIRVFILLSDKHSIKNLVYEFLFDTTTCVGRDSSVGIATRYGLDGPGIESRWGARFSAPVQTDPGAYPASCTMGTGSFPGVKRLGRGADYPPPSSAEVKKE